MPRLRSNPAVTEYLTPQEAAEVLKVTPLTVRRWVKAGTLKATKIGRLWRIRRTEIDRLLSGDRSG